MAVSVFKTFSAGEVLTASDLNSSLTQITTNGEDLGWPATKAKDLNGQELILDIDSDTSITASTDDQIDFRVGAADVVVLTATALDINGLELILDADADTSITADTDDVIDIKLAGSDLIKINSTGILFSGANIIPLTKHKTADQSLDTDATVGDDNTLIDYSLAVGVYEIFGDVLANGPTAGGFRWRLNVDSGTVDFSAINVVTVDTGENLVDVVGDIDTDSTVTITTLASTGRNVLRFGGIISVSVAAVLSFQWSQASSNGSSTTVEDGSYLGFRLTS